MPNQYDKRAGKVGCNVIAIEICRFTAKAYRPSHHHHHHHYGWFTLSRHLSKTLRGVDIYAMNICVRCVFGFIHTPQHAIKSVKKRFMNIQYACFGFVVPGSCWCCSINLNLHLNWFILFFLAYMWFFLFSKSREEWEGENISLKSGRAWFVCKNYVHHQSITWIRFFSVSLKFSE